MGCMSCNFFHAHAHAGNPAGNTSCCAYVIVKELLSLQMYGTRCSLLCRRARTFGVDDRLQFGVDGVHMHPLGPSATQRHRDHLLLPKKVPRGEELGCVERLLRNTLTHILLSRNYTQPHPAASSEESICNSDALAASCHQGLLAHEIYHSSRNAKLTRAEHILSSEEENEEERSFGELFEQGRVRRRSCSEFVHTHACSAVCITVVFMNTGQ